MRNAKFRTWHFEICNWTERGFSLLELLVVCLLLGLASAFVFPSIEKGLRERELRAAALKIAAVARDLRSRAVYENSAQHLKFDPSENSYQAFDREKVTLSPDIKIIGIEGGEPIGDGLRQFLFFPNGSILGREITLSGNEGSSYTVRLDQLLGRVEVVRGNRQ